MSLQQLNTTLTQLTTAEQTKILPKLQLFAACDSKPESKAGNVYIPPLVRCDIVHCDFTGVGYEWDGAHYGVIWEANPEFDAVTVIPTTSQVRPEYANVFSVGKIPGLNDKQTTLLVSDMTKVSRKRITALDWNHPKSGKRKVFLAQSWIPRITQAIVATYGNENTFSDYLMNNFGAAMVNNLLLLRDWKFIPVRCEYDSHSAILSYRKWNEAIFQTTQLVMPKSGMYIKKEEKKDLVKRLISSDPAVRAQAEADFHRLYVDIAG